MKQVGGQQKLSSERNSSWVTTVKPTPSWMERIKEDSLWSWESRHPTKPLSLEYRLLACLVVLSITRQCQGETSLDRDGGGGDGFGLSVWLEVQACKAQCSSGLRPSNPRDNENRRIAERCRRGVSSEMVQARRKAVEAPRL